MTTQLIVWNERTEGTHLPDFTEDGLAKWWMHVFPNEPRPSQYMIGDVMHMYSVLAPPALFRSRWKVIAIEQAPERYRAVFGPTLHLVTAERVPDART